MLDFDVEAIRARDFVRGTLRDVEQWRLDDAEAGANRVDEHVKLGSIEAEAHMILEEALPPALASRFVADLIHQNAAALAV